MFDKLIFREAQIDDVHVIVELLLDDVLGKTREDISQINVYTEQFKRIAMSQTQKLFVVEFGEDIIGCCELSILYSLTLSCGTRLFVEGVRVNKNHRSHGIGAWMFDKIKLYAKESNCSLIQLTTNKIRTDAHKFYTKLGFENSHEGFKLKI